MKPLGIISGTLVLEGVDDLAERHMETPFGPALVLTGHNIVYLPRHGRDPLHHIYPHLINHAANMSALQSLGVGDIITLNSTGSLKRDLPPGSLVVPDDFICLTSTPTVGSGRALHITPTFSDSLRSGLLEAARDCALQANDGGVYWQTPGPRFETRAEIRMMSQFADVVGMTVAGEAVIARELGMQYAALCSVDNYAHGLGEGELTFKEVLRYSRRNAEVVRRIALKFIERRFS